VVLEVAPTSIWHPKTPARHLLAPKTPAAKLLLLRHVVVLRLLKLLWGRVLRGLRARWGWVVVLHLRTEVLLLLWWTWKLLHPCCCSCARIIATVVTVPLPLDSPMAMHRLHGRTCKASQHTEEISISIEP
jgi:hypothetical protein